MTDIAEALARPIVLAEGCALWDVEYIKEGGRWYLKIYIEREGGVSTEHCERVSRALEAQLDEKDPIKEPYILEVSSAGIEKTLKRPEHFERFIGSEIEVSFYTPKDGAKTLKGELSAYGGGSLTVGEKTFDLKEIAKAKQIYNF